MKKCILILGMHRSGTSLMAGILRLLGIDFGENLMGSAPSNELGHFEHNDIYRINEAILKQLDSSWDDINELPDLWHKKEELNSYKEEIKNIINKDFGGSNIFGIKDPRISILLPLYLDIFSDLNIEPLFIILKRGAAEISKSLEKRDSFIFLKSLNLIAKYERSIEKFIENEKKVYISFSDLVNYPKYCVEKIKDNLGVQLKNYDTFESDLVKFIDPRLKHHNLLADELVKELFLTLDGTYKNLRKEEEIIIVKEKEMRELEFVKEKELQELELVKEREMRELELVKEREMRELEFVKEKELQELKLVKEREINQFKSSLLCEKNYRESIERSLTFKLLRVYQRFIDFILPEGFFIRKYYNKLINFNQTFINREFRVGRIIGTKTNKIILDGFNNIDILFVNHAESRTGAPKILLEIAKYCKARYKIAILSKRQGSMHDEFVGNFKNLIYSNDLRPALSKFEKAREIILDVRPKLIYVNCLINYEYAVEAKKLGIPVIFHIHELKSEFNNVLDISTKEKFNGMADVFIAPSEIVKDYLFKEINCPENKIKVIHEFIDFNDVLERSSAIMPEIIKRAGEVLIFGSGTVCRRKGTDILSMAINKLKETGCTCRVVWLGENVNHYFQVAKELDGKDDNFILLGEKENPFPYLKQADVFVLPSREDPFPLVVLEALALGKPVIAFSENVGSKEVIDENCGIIVDKTDAGSLAVAISVFVRRQADFRKKAAKIGPQKIKDNYDSEIILPKIKNLIDELLNKKLLGADSQNNKVSVIIPSYNYGWCISEAIESVLCQTYKNWELIIVDDFSTDNSLEIIDEYIKNYPDKIRLAGKELKDKGIAGSYRAGIENAKGHYVCFLEADDIFLEDSIGARVNIFEKNPQIVMVFNKPKIFGAETEVVYEKEKNIARHFKGMIVPENQPFNALGFLLDRNIVSTFSSVMVKKEALKGLDYSEKFKAWFDWWFNSQLSKKGMFYYLPLEKTLWRAHKNSFNYKYAKEINIGEKVKQMREAIIKDEKNQPDENPLYVFLHMPKCAGSTIIKNIMKNMQETEYLSVYFGEGRFKNFESVELFLNSLTNEQKNKIKIIFGHHAFFGIHKFFAGRNPKYITFLRDPTERTISHYNYCRTDYELGGVRGHSPKIVNEAGKIISFNEWISKNEIIDDYMSKIFLCNFFRKKETKRISSKDADFLKKMLKEFYFIGLCEDFDKGAEVLYAELGLRKVVEKENVSKKFVKSEDIKITEQTLENMNKADKEIYRIVLEANNKERKV